ncbi:hypothetical protein ACFQI3_02525 [Hansschlegelia quercus]|uniref:Uncharacterized protein n=1 Tax=Hansschlegelia quercus TaxID=2528245 RepID=A0A4Q9GPS9_9HYPH|nr:hypothetical protein [Hansschlegelia quercus]TBN54804.1 hypothetical protein EYR15_01155 [Hansschlegelia quercus]
MRLIADFESDLRPAQPVPTAVDTGERAPVGKSHAFRLAALAHRRPQPLPPTFSAKAQIQTTEHRT